MPPENQESQDRLGSAKSAFDAARQYQRDWLEYGTERVHLHYEGVEGDWLEQWGGSEPITPHEQEINSNLRST